MQTFTVMNDTLSHKTVFVKGIPASCSNDQLKETFSVHGPIKEAFVVKTKSEHESKKCIGFVTYQTNDDAKSAVNASPSTLEVDGHKLNVIFAKKKKFSKGNKNKRKAAVSNEEAGFDIVPLECDNSDKTVEKVEEVATSNKFIVAIEGLKSINDISSLWKKKSLGEINSADVKKENETVLVSFPNKQKALKATARINNTYFNDVVIHAALQVDTDSKEFRKSSKKSRLIIRNLSFFCTEDELKSEFKRFGKITEVKIPVKPDGKKRGFAFVQFSHVLEAGKAIKEVNMSEIKGRKVAVDWALPREKYQEITKSDTKDEEVPKQEETTDLSEKASIEDDSQKEEEEEEKEQEEESEMEEDESEVEDEEEDEGSSEDESMDEEKQEEGAVKDKEADKKSKPQKRTESSDVHEGKTVFIRNLSYESEEAELKIVMEKFGDINYCKIVINKATGLPKGSAFVQFATKEEAEKCIEAPQISLDGRDLFVTLATTRAESTKLVKVKKEEGREKEDKRNLYLANEGLIRPGTQAAEGLSEIELNKRQRIENAKRLKLKNSNIFVSTTRLCVHNLPRAVDDAKLKELVNKVFENENRKPKIIECRVMRDREKKTSNGVGRSLGFAFVALTKHEDSLKALRSLNNNPEIFGALKRPIVEFSLENRLAIEAQMQKRKRQLTRNELKGAVENTAPKKKRKWDVPKPKVEKSKVTPSPILSKVDRKPFQGSTGTTLSGKKLKMPKHSGLKIRKRNKGNVLAQIKESKKLNRPPSVRNAQANKKQARAARPEPQQPKEKRQRRSGKSKDVQMENDFNKLVAKYTSKFSSKLKGKWHES
uniref:RNA-binding protein 28 n=1 Tax=Ciona intestinalis TaxID=7719 RepID=UPI00089DAD1D|nr:RNA-binding protein 28 [Ciona intestinalis]|eukprot:XP_002130575.2 RNA-binding protein 28 [Ciona intestinalis]